MRHVLIAIGLLLLAESIVSADPVPIPVTDRQVLPPGAGTMVGPGLSTGMPSDEFNRPMAPYPDPLGDPPWCESPYRNSAWRFEIGFIPTVSTVSDQAFGEWDDSGGLALRLNFGYEGCDGYGTRLQFWAFGQEADTFLSEIDLGASTFYWDFYKRFFIEDAELVLGGGLAGSHLEYDLKTLNEDANFSGGGISVFGESFYPFWRFEKTDVGSIARARLALLSGRWEDNGTPFMSDTDHDLMTILEVAWGLEIRRRFGRMQDKYWYIDIVPEFQRWESSSLPDAFDPGFQGTNFSFGLAW